MFVSDTSILNRSALFHAALVCGVGRGAMAAVAGLAEFAAGAISGRTCIDRGSALMLVVRAPGPRVLDVCTRQPDMTDGVQDWRRCRSEDGRSETWRTRLFLGAPQLAYGEARNLAQRAGFATEFSRLHAGIGPAAQLFFTATQETFEGQRVWVGWHLDRHLTPSQTLSNCGLADLWPAAARVFEPLLGKGLPLRTRGWSLLAGFGDDGTRFRVGTSLWSRVPETPSKLSSCKAVVSALGGDPAFVEALYKLLLQDYDGLRFVPPVGCAAEVELRPNGSASGDFFLRVPAPAIPVAARSAEVLPLQAAFA